MNQIAARNRINRQPDRAGNRTNRRLDTSRLEEKRRYRKKQKLKRRISAVVLAVVLCVISFWAGRCTAPKQSPVYGKAAESAAEKEEKRILNTVSIGADESGISMGDEEKLQYVESHPQEYPKSLLDFLKKTPEAADFVYSYPEYAGKEQKIDLSDECKEGEIPLFLQWDKRWGYEEYGDDMIALSGCGPTCLSMVYVGLTGDTSMNPKAMAGFSEENGFYLENVGTSWDLMGAGAEELGLSCDTIPLSEEAIREELDSGHPLICSMRPGDFTDSGHFIVIYGEEKNGFLIRDPNSPERSARMWSYAELKDQIKNIWAYSVSVQRR